MELNWPAAALVFGLTTLVLFRTPLSRLLERTEKVKDWLVAPKQPATTAPLDQALPTHDVVREQLALETLTAGFASQVLLLQEQNIRSDLGTHGLTADTAAEKVLVKHLAGTQIALRFERVYSLIYRSQLLALRWLNAQPDGVHGDALLPFYQDGVKAWPALYVGYDFRAWLSFLAGNGLLAESDASAAADDEASPFGLVITVLGREFLAFLVHSGRPDPVLG